MRRPLLTWRVGKEQSLANAAGWEMLAFSQTLGSRGVFAGIGAVATLGVIVELEGFGVAG